MRRPQELTEALEDAPARLGRSVAVLDDLLHQLRELQRAEVAGLPPEMAGEGTGTFNQAPSVVVRQALHGLDQFDQERPQPGLRPILLNGDRGQVGEHGHGLHVTDTERRVLVLIHQGQDTDDPVVE